MSKDHNRIFNLPLCSKTVEGDKRKKLDLRENEV